MNPENEAKLIEREIQWCSDYLESGKPDRAGAMMGIDDWIMEQALMEEDHEMEAD